LSAFANPQHIAASHAHAPPVADSARTAWWVVATTRIATSATTIAAPRKPPARGLIDKSFLLAMARDDGPSRTKDIQERLDIDGNFASEYRPRLIASELIESTGHGYVDFAPPYLRD